MKMEPIEKKLDELIQLQKFENGLMHAILKELAEIGYEMRLKRKTPVPKKTMLQKIKEMLRWKT